MPLAPGGEFILEKTSWEIMECSQNVLKTYPWTLYCCALPDEPPDGLDLETATHDSYSSVTPCCIHFRIPLENRSLKYDVESREQEAFFYGSPTCGQISLATPKQSATNNQQSFFTHPSTFVLRLKTQTPSSKIPKYARAKTSHLRLNKQPLHNRRPSQSLPPTPKSPSNHLLDLYISRNTTIRHRARV